jgi:AcrR family transcriptional regulator
MADSADIATPSRPATARFEKRKEAVLAAAIEVLNKEGLKGMTLAGVAARVHLTTTSLTYYYKRKELLAVDCFLHGLGRLEAMVEAAAKEPELSGRIGALLDEHLALQIRVRDRREPPMTIFSDVRALSDEHRAPVAEAYLGLFDKVQALFAAPGYFHLDRLARAARAHMLLEQLSWSTAWRATMSRTFPACGRGCSTSCARGWRDRVARSRRPRCRSRRAPSTSEGATPPARPSCAPPPR